MDENKDILSALEYFGFDEGEADSLIKSMSKEDEKDIEKSESKDKESMPTLDSIMEKISEGKSLDEKEKSMLGAAINASKDEKMEKSDKKDNDYEEKEDEEDIKKASCDKSDMKKSETSKEEEKDDSKTENEDLVKSMMDELSKNKEREDELMKAVTSMKDTISDMSERLEKTENQYEGRKTVTNRDFLKKSVTDDDGHEMISISKNKQGTIDSLEKGMRSASDETLKKSYTECLINYNMGSAEPTREVAEDLFKSHSIRLVK